MVKMYCKKNTVKKNSLKNLFPLLFFCFSIFIPLESASKELKIFRIGTGSPGGTYFTVGALIAYAISNPIGSRACHRGGSCGVKDLEAVAKSSAGSVQNIQNLRAGKVEAAIVQSDTAWLAYHGKGIFAKDGPFKELSVVSILWPEDLHLVVRRNQNLKHLTDLYNKPISLGAIGSGTLLNAELALYAQGISISQISPYYNNFGQSGKNLTTKKIDAFFLMAGWPVSTIEVLLEDQTADLLSLDDQIIQKLTSEYPWLTQSIIPKNAYNLEHDTVTLGQSSLLVTTQDQTEELIYQITRSIWNPNNHEIYSRGFQGQDLMQLDRQKQRPIIPLHKGALKWQNETFKTTIDPAP